MTEPRQQVRAYPKEVIFLDSAVEADNVVVRAALQQIDFGAQLVMLRASHIDHLDRQYEPRLVDGAIDRRERTARRTSLSMTILRFS